MDDLLSAIIEHGGSSGGIFLLGIVWMERIRRDLKHIGQRLSKVEAKLGISDDHTPPGASPIAA